MLGPQGAELPQSRVNALWSLEGLKALGDDDIVGGLNDRDSHVRAVAVQLSAGRLRRSRALLARVLAVAEDADPVVGFQAALALGESADALVEPALLRIARTHAADPWMRSAVLCSCGQVAARMFVDLAGEGARRESAGDGILREQLAGIVGVRDRRDEINQVLDHLATKESDASQRAVRDGLIMALARGLRRTGGRFDAVEGADNSGARLVAGMVGETRTSVVDHEIPEAARLSAIGRLAVLDPARCHEVIAKVLESREPPAVQLAGVRALGESESPAVAAILLSRLRGFEPAVRSAAIGTLLKRGDWTKELLEAVSRNDPASGLSPSLIEPADRTALLKNQDKAIATTARKLFARGVPQSRAKVVADYLAVIGTKGDAALGAKVFARECKSCHKIGETGFALGPDLTGSPSSDPSALLANILDPNASVTPKDVQYLVVDGHGRTYSGVIGSETATSLTLRRGEGTEDTILRSQIAEIASTGLSLMPEGLETKITKPEMADLIAFLCAAHRDGDGESGSERAGSRPLDVGTLPGLIEPDD